MGPVESFSTGEYSIEIGGHMADYDWQPISPLSPEERAVDIAEIQALYASWRSANSRLRQEAPESLNRFTQKLIRSLAIETGILERVYDLDMGTTEALIAQGFAEDLVTHSSTNIEPSLLIDILRDQESAIHLVMECVTAERPLSVGFIHQLHATLTRHQPTTRAVDQFGAHFDVTLLHGAFKELPNNPTRPDGGIHHYAPPIQVASQVDQLLAWLQEDGEEDPLIVTAWFHHRFTQIHPYQDGNGRVARALSTLILLRAQLLPLVVHRDLRTEYIDALAVADRGDLSQLVHLFATLEKRSILQALSVDADAAVQQDMSITRAVIQSITQKIDRRKQIRADQLRHVNELAKRLRDETRLLVTENLDAVSEAASSLARAEVFITPGGPDRDNAHWYKLQVIDSGKSGGKWVNFEEDHYFLKAAIRLENLRLVFVASFHHIGREPSGIVEVTSFAWLENFEDDKETVPTSEKYFVCSLEPFVLTWNTEFDKILPTYHKWLDAALAVALKEWGDKI
jgi:Fic family protein